MFKRVQKTVQSSTRKTRIGKKEKRSEKRAKKRGIVIKEREKKEDHQETKDEENRSKEVSREVRDLEWKEESKVREKGKKVSSRIMNVSLARRQGNRCPFKNIELYYRLKEEIYAKKKKSLLFVLR